MEAVPSSTGGLQRTGRWCRTAAGRNGSGEPNHPDAPHCGDCMLSGIHGYEGGGTGVPLAPSALSCACECAYPGRIHKRQFATRMVLGPNHWHRLESPGNRSRRRTHSRPGIHLTPAVTGSRQILGTTQHPAAKNVLARRSGNVCSSSLKIHHESRPYSTSDFETARPGAV